MSDTMFMLESHLSADQSRAVSQVQLAAAEAGLHVFLTGGALRDMLAGFPILEIDFTVEGSGVKLARAIAQKGEAEVLECDENRKTAQMVFSGGVRASISMARQEKFPKPGGKPQVQAATIHEDLRGRDFTINSIALSLGQASRGLLLDPNNGVGDIEKKELRAVTNFTLYDDPVRMLRLQRFKVRLGFTVAERTLAQFTNALEAGLEKKIAVPSLLEEFRKVAAEQNVADLVKVLEDEKLLTLYSPLLSGAKVNMPGLHRLQKAKQMIPNRVDSGVDSLPVFLSVLTEKFTPAEQTSFGTGLGLDEATMERWQKLDSRSKKLEKDLKSAPLVKPSRLYQTLSKAAGDQVLFLAAKSSDRLVQDRIKNYFQKYLPAAEEVTEGDVIATGVQPGTPKFEKAKAALIGTRLDARPKKVPIPEPVELPPPPPPPTHPFARRKQTTA